MRKKRHTKKPASSTKRPELDRTAGLVKKYFRQIQHRDINGSANDFDEDRVFDVIKNRIAQQARQRRLNQLKIAASFIGFICLSAFAFWFYSSSTNSSDKLTVLSAEKADVKPGGDKAILTLADGSVIDLTERATGEIASQGGMVVTKTEDGQLVYHLENEGLNSEIAYNSIATPRGGQFAVVLPDGSRVWLNADSKLKYPASFKGDSRTVELIGEGYFEVERDEKRPFRIKSKDQVVTVLGTKFNINSYEDESFMRTTLLEGSVQVEKGQQSLILKPGEQARVKESIQVAKVNTLHSMAWKNGDFIFRNESIRDIMRQVSRWYDVEIEYQGGNESLRFGGIVSRAKDLSAVLTMLEKTGQVKFEVLMNAEKKERRIRVTFI